MSIRIYLPLAERSSGRATANQADVQLAHLQKGSETILVVEDDARLRKVLSRRLRGLGYQIIEADNEVAALAVLAAQPDIALIFTDMPGNDGSRTRGKGARGGNRPQGPVHLRLRRA